MPCNNNDKSNVEFCASAKIMCKFVRNRTYPYPAGGCNVENPRNEQTIWQWNENHYMKDALRAYLLKTRVWWMQILACLLLAGCAELLPKSKEEVASPWHSYQEAQTALERVVPYQTTKAELKAAGVDPFTQPNIALLTYSDVILRFPLGGAVPQEKLDRGLRECLNAGKACHGYAIAVRDIKRDRTANFWLDSLKFYRRVDVSGWSFNAIILLVDDTVVYTLYGGQPMIREQEDSKQPLGPLQNWGDVLPGLVH